MQASASEPGFMPCIDSEITPHCTLQGFAPNEMAAQSSLSAKRMSTVRKNRQDQARPNRPASYSFSQSSRFGDDDCQRSALPRSNSRPGMSQTALPSGSSMDLSKVAKVKGTKLPPVIDYKPKVPMKNFGDGPKYTFGATPSNGSLLSYKKNRNLAPGDYDVYSTAFAGQALSHTKSLPSWSFAAPGRESTIGQPFPKPRRVNGPPPAKFDLDPALGRQANSQRRSAATFSFGASQEDRFGSSSEARPRRLHASLSDKLGATGSQSRVAGTARRPATSPAFGSCVSRWDDAVDGKGFAVQRQPGPGHYDVKPDFDQDNPASSDCPRTVAYTFNGRPSLKYSSITAPPPVGTYF